MKITKNEVAHLKEPHRWLYGWVGQKGSYTTLIRDRNIYARLDALYERMPEDGRRSFGFNENGKQAECGDFYFVREDVAMEHRMIHVYRRSVLRQCKKCYPLDSLLEKLAEMKEMFDVIEAVILDSLGAES